MQQELDYALDSDLDETTSSYSDTLYDLDEMYARHDTSYEALAYRHYA